MGVAPCPKVEDLGRDVDANKKTLDRILWTTLVGAIGVVILLLEMLATHLASPAAAAGL